MGKVVKIENVRIMWPDLLTATRSKKFPNNAPTFKVVLKLDDVRLKEAAVDPIEEVQKAIQEKTGEDYSLPPSLVETDTGDVQLRLTCPEARRPMLADEFGQDVKDPGKFYAGCYCDVWMDIFTSTTYGNKVSASLTAVQFRADGEPLDGRPTRDDLFSKADENTEANPWD